MSKLFGGKPNTTSAGGSVPRNPAARGTHLAAGSDFEGRVFLRGPSSIACNFKGEIEGDNLVIIEQGAKINATIRAANIIIHGEVVGDLFARDGVEIASTGIYTGNINAPKAKVGEGAQMRGQLNISTAATEPAAQPTKAIELSPAQAIGKGAAAGNVTPLDIKLSGDRVVVNPQAIATRQG